MRNMFNKHLVFLEQSKDCVKKTQGEDTYMALACFNAHKALEFLFKAIIEATEFQQPKTHDLDELLVYVNNREFKYSETDSLNSIVMFVNKWEATSRYDSGIEVYASRLKLVYEHIDRLSKEFLEWKGSEFKKMESTAALESDANKVLQQLKDSL